MPNYRQTSSTAYELTNPNKPGCPVYDLTNEFANQNEPSFPVHELTNRSQPFATVCELTYRYHPFSPVSRQKIGFYPAVGFIPFQYQYGTHFVFHSRLCVLRLRFLLDKKAQTCCSIRGMSKDLLGDDMLKGSSQRHGCATKKLANHHGGHFKWPCRTLQLSACPANFEGGFPGTSHAPSLPHYPRPNGGYIWRLVWCSCINDPNVCFSHLVQL